MVEITMPEIQSVDAFRSFRTSLLVGLRKAHVNAASLEFINVGHRNKEASSDDEVQMMYQAKNKQRPGLRS